MTFERMILIGALAAVVGCGRGDAHESAFTAPKSASYSELPAGGASVFDLELELTDQRGRRLSLENFRGRPTVVSMFYADCPYACPTLISDVRRLEEKLDEATREGLRVLLVSFDSERDTPERLGAVARERKLDGERWTLARASEDHVRELAAVLGFKYRRLSDGGYNHSSAIVLLRSDGTMAARSEGLAQPLDELASHATSLVASGN